VIWRGEAEAERQWVLSRQATTKQQVAKSTDDHSAKKL